MWQLPPVCSLQVVGTLSLPGCDPVRSFPVGAKFSLGGVPGGAHDPSKNEVSNLEISVADPRVVVLSHAVLVGLSSGSLTRPN